MKTNTTVLAAMGLMTAITGAHSLANTIPARPEQIEFKPLQFEPPVAKDYRRVLPKTGVPVYLLPSNEFPLVTITLSFKGGQYMEPAGKDGLAGLTGQMIRRGGTATVPAQDVDEKFDFLASNASVGIGSTTASATLNSLTSNLNESFPLFMDMVRNPGFQSDKFDIVRAETIENMKQRNDDADNIIGREWSALMWGREHFEGRVATKTSLDSVTIEDMKAFHQRLIHPGNLIVGVTGDFKEADMLAMLDSAFEGWAKGEPVGDPPAPSASVQPGVYHIEKEIPQGKVRIGMRGITRDDPDAIPVAIMNDILGGGGFTSRIMNRVRTEEGLAYGAGSAFINKVWYPGEFRSTFASKNRTCALALKIIMDECQKIRSEPVSEEELNTAKNQFIDTFPRTFESKAGTLGVFINDEWTKRPEGYWQNFREKVRSVDTKEVQRVAQKYITPENMFVLVVGKWDEIKAGDPAQQDLAKKVTMNDFFGGKAEQLPLRDPLTQEPIEAGKN